jgi:hypothetical protein
MFTRVRLLWQLVGLYEEVEGMDTFALVKVLVSFVMGLVATGGALFLAGTDPLHALTGGAAGGIATAVGYLKQSPVSVRGPAPSAAS